MSISTTSFSVVSLMAMVPESEWRMPTLIVSSALAVTVAIRVSARPAAVCDEAASLRRVEIVQSLNMDEPRVIG